jgi:hypothetical protein
MLEKGAEDLKRARRKNLSIKAGIFLSLLVLTMAAFPRGELYRYTVEVGDEWRQETLVAPFGFAIYKDDAERASEREQVRYTTPPFFTQDESAQEAVRENRDDVEEQAVQVFDPPG